MFSEINVPVVDFNQLGRRERLRLVNQSNSVLKLLVPYSEPECLGWIMFTKFF